MRILEDGKEVFEKPKKKKRVGLIVGILMMVLGVSAFFILPSGFEEKYYPQPVEEEIVMEQDMIQEESINIEVEELTLQLDKYYARINDLENNLESYKEEYVQVQETIEYLTEEMKAEVPDTAIGRIDPLAGRSEIRRDLLERYYPERNRIENEMRYTEEEIANIESNIDFVEYQLNEVITQEEMAYEDDMEEVSMTMAPSPAGFDVILGYAKDIISMLSTLTGLIITLVTVLRKKKTPDTAGVQVSVNT